MGPLIPLFWTSGDVCPGFQSQDGPSPPPLACDLACAQWISQVHPWCDTCRPLDGHKQDGSHIAIGISQMFHYVNSFEDLIIFQIYLNIPVGCVSLIFFYVIILRKGQTQRSSASQRSHDLTRGSTADLSHDQFQPIRFLLPPFCLSAYYVNKDVLFHKN